MEGDNRFRAAARAHQAGLLDEAEEIYLTLLKESRSGAVAANLGSLYRNRRELIRAKDFYRWALKTCNPNAALYLNAANLMVEIGSRDEARIILKDANHKLDNNFTVAKAYALLLIEQGEEIEAINILTQKDWKELEQTKLITLLQKALTETAYNQHTIEDLKKIIKRSPIGLLLSSMVIMNLKNSGNTKEALELMKQIEAMYKNSSNNNHFQKAKAAILKEIEQTEIAERIYSNLCRVDKKDPSNFINLAACQRDLKRIVSPLKTVCEGLKLFPDNSQLRMGLLQISSDIGNEEITENLLHTWINNNEITKNSNSHRSFQFVGAAQRLIDSKILRKKAQEWEADKLKNFKLREIWKDRIREKWDTKRRIRIGYISSDFCNHPVGRFMVPILRSHDARKWHVFGIDAGTRKDELNKIIRSSCQTWCDVSSGTDIQIARTIAELDLDILIELGGYTGGSRIGALVYKPAPIQISYLGYFAPVFLDCIDGWIGDKQLFSTLDEEESSIRQIVIPGGYMVYAQENPPIIDEQTSRYFRFGIINNSRKYSNAFMETVATILRRCPDAQLIIKSICFVEPEGKKRIIHRLEEYGINIQRVILLDWERSDNDYLKSYNQIDVCLDPFPYGGATSTCDSLIMGIPVITTSGKGMVGQLAASILKNSSQKHNISKNREDYVEKAVSYWKKGVRHKRDREKLRRKVMRSPLMDAKRFTSALENQLLRNITQLRMPH